MSAFIVHSDAGVEAWQHGLMLIHGIHVQMEARVAGDGLFVTFDNVDLTARNGKEVLVVKL